MCKTLGIDFDDTLVDFSAQWCKYHLRKYGESHEQFWGSEEGLRRSYEFVHSRFHLLVPAIEGAIEAIQALSQKRDLVIITARDDSLTVPTLNLLEKHFPKAFKRAHFLHQGNKNIFGTKGDMCKKFNVDEFIDDSVAHVTATRDAQIRSFLFTTVTNKNLRVSGVTRVNSWNEMLEHIS